MCCSAPRVGATAPTGALGGKGDFRADSVMPVICTAWCGILVLRIVRGLVCRLIRWTPRKFLAPPESALPATPATRSFDTIR